MDLSVIIVNWNTKDLLDKCLGSINKYTNGVDFEVVVFDNGSEDGSQGMVKKKYPETILIENPTNDGFVKGNLEGYEKSSGEYILMLNSDTELIENSFKKMVDFAKERGERFGILGPKLLNTDGSLQPSCRRFPTLISQIFVMLKLHNLFPKWGPIGNYYMADFDYSKTVRVDQVMGAALLTSRKVIREVGFLDKKFWAWFEEVDFCKRVKDAEYKNYFFAGTKLYHHKGQSFKNLAKRQRVFNESMRYYFRKHFPVWQFYVLVLLWPVNMVLSYLTQFLLLFLPLKKSKDL